jgi:uncharacterized RDD family membrane protein YckC
MDTHSSATYSDEQYAGFFRRLIAGFIDMMIVANVGRIIGLRIFSSENLMLAGFSFTLGLIYFGYMESSKLQGTIGKIFMKIKVVNLNGSRINVLKAVARYLLRFLSLVVVGVGLLMILWTDRKQSLHDIITKTIVIKR